MQSKHHLWDLVSSGISTLNFFRYKVQRVREVVDNGDPWRLYRFWNVLEFAYALQAHEEFVDKVDHISNVAGVCDEINESHGSEDTEFSIKRGTPADKQESASMG